MLHAVRYVQCPEYISIAENASPEASFQAVGRALAAPAGPESHRVCNRRRWNLRLLSTLCSEKPDRDGQSSAARRAPGCCCCLTDPILRPAKNMPPHNDSDAAVRRAHAAFSAAAARTRNHLVNSGVDCSAASSQLLDDLIAPCSLTDKPDEPDRAANSNSQGGSSSGATRQQRHAAR